MAAAPIVPHASREAIHIGLEEAPFVDLGDRSAMQLLHVDLSQGLWIVRMRFQPGYRIARHYHTGPVYAVTQRGSWRYIEYPDQVNRAGSYLFEPAGSVHTLVVPEDQAGDTEVWFAVFGANVNIGEDGQVLNVLDAATVLGAYRALCEARGESSQAVIVAGA
ncbi:2,4'-dihydroxyacetophenone dioxygenase family protein [Phenylobacterium sp.]|uniref:2,4'-dihydroxyacetophenone dioxygenase family protein n=1 Tax=Phenylobacterium sp. TaxID=1871053 RepID=UPI0035B08DC4